MAFCIHCGKQLMDGARFCAFCGQSTNGNIAMQGNSAGNVVRLPVTEASVAKGKSAFDANKIIAYLHDYLGIDAEKTEDGGVRATKRRYNEKADMYELDLAVTPMTTPSGYKVKGIRLPEGVTEIGDQAFYMAWGLEYIELPSTLRRIGEDAFNDTNLVEIVIPEGVQEIGAGAFHDCNDLKKATVKCPIRVMPAALFMACESLEEVVLPEGLQEIGENAFDQCTVLHKYNIPDSVRRIARGAFFACEQLTTFTVPEGVVEMESAFGDCTRLKTINLPSTLKKLGNYALSDNPALSSIQLPDGMEEIGQYAFRGCIALTAIDIPRSVKKIDWGAFEGCTALRSVVLHSGVQIQGGAFRGCIAEVIRQVKAAFPAYRE